MSKDPIIKKLREAQRSFKKPKILSVPLLVYVNDYLDTYNLEMNLFIYNASLNVAISDKEVWRPIAEAGLDISGKSIEQIEAIRIYLMYLAMGVGLENPQETEQKQPEQDSRVNNEEYHELFMALASCQELMQPILNHYKVAHLSLIKRSEFKDCISRINLLKLTRR